MIENGQHSLKDLTVLAGKTHKRSMVFLFAVMSCLACIFLFITIMAFQVGTSWSTAFKTGYTVELRPLPELAKDEQMRTAMIVLKNDPGIEDVKQVSDEQVNDMIAPWLGGDKSLLKDLPLSQLIAVQLKEDKAEETFGRLQGMIEQIPGASMETFNNAVKEFNVATQAIRFICIAAIALIFAACGAVVSATTYTNVIENKHILDILRIIGAENSYIVHLFRKNLMVAGSQGVCLGFLLACFFFVVISGLAIANGLQEFVLFNQIIPHFFEASLILIVPVIMIYLTWVTASICIKKALSVNEQGQGFGQEH